MSGRRILDLVLVLCALVTTAAVLSRSSWFDRAPADGAVGFDGWQRDLQFDRRIGPADAPYRLAVWFDYQCPACRQFEEGLGRVRRQLKDSLAVIYRHYPLTIHPLAFRAAVAAECAREQGHFASMHRALLAVPLGSESLPLESLVSQSGLTDPHAFRRCLADSTSVAVAAVRKDLDRAQVLNLRGTPGVQIGDRVATGSIPAEELLARLRATRD